VRQFSRSCSDGTVIHSSASARLIGVACFVLLLGACTEPTSFFGGPLFITLVDGAPDSGASVLRSAFGGLPPLPSDSCPRIAPLPPTATRRGVPGGNGMTIAIPDVPGVLTSDLRPERGAVFRIPNQGHVIVTFDNKLPAVDFSRGAAFSNPFWTEQWRDHRACRVQIGGRPALLWIDQRVERYRRVDDSGIVDTNVFLRDAMLVTIPEQDGTSTFITLFGRTQTGLTIGNQASVLSLLPYAASARW
jgi:hypothetical protein